MNNSNAKHSGQKSAENGSKVSESPEAYSKHLTAARQFVKKWAKSGPAMEELKFRRLQQLDDEAARKMTLDLFAMWQPRAFEDPGSGLVELQRIFARLRERQSERRPNHPRNER